MRRRALFLWQTHHAFPLPGSSQVGKHLAPAMAVLSKSGKNDRQSDRGDGDTRYMASPFRQDWKARCLLLKWREGWLMEVWPSSHTQLPTVELAVAAPGEGGRKLLRSLSHLYYFGRPDLRLCAKGDINLWLCIHGNLWYQSYLSPIGIGFGIARFLLAICFWYI